MTNPFSFKKSMVAIAVIQALSINVSSAATIMVTNSSDSNAVAGCTLREAITSITDGAVSGGCVNTGTAFGTNDTINFSPNVNTVNLSAGQLSISDSSLSINEGGASVTIQGDSSDRIFNIESSVVSINNMTITGGSSTSRGGGISTTESEITIVDSVVSNNSASSSGGINSTGGSVTLLRSSVSNNSAVSVGGMLLSGRGGSSLTLDSSVVSDNRAYYGAGGLQLQSSTVNIVNSTISDNTASYYGYGGGLAIFTSLPISITNSTISGNSVGGRGGGMYLYTGRGGETVNINNTTISNNSSREDGGGIAIIYAQVSLSNSIVSGNRDDDLRSSEIWVQSFYKDEFSSISFFGTNVLGDSANTYRNAFSLSNGGIPEDTQIIATEDGNTPTPISNILAPLADNGGPTQTHALVDGSPAIDAGDNITCEDSDQRFEIRPDGPSCDIGAFEGGSPNSEPESEPATFVIPLPNGRVVVFDL